MNVQTYNCQQKLTALLVQRQSMKDEMNRALSEIILGHFCSKCGRSPTEIEEEEHMSFAAHLDTVHGYDETHPYSIIQASENAKMKFQRKIDDINTQIRQQEINCYDIKSSKDNTTREREDYISSYVAQQITKFQEQLNNVEQERNDRLNYINSLNRGNVGDGNSATDNLRSYDSKNAETDIYGNKVKEIDNFTGKGDELSDDRSINSGDVLFFWCHNNYVLHYEVTFEKEDEEISKIVAGTIDHTSLSLSIKDPDPNKLEEMKISYRLSINLGEQGKLQYKTLTKDDFNIPIDLGGSRFRHFSIENVYATFNPHYPGESKTDNIRSTDNGIEIGYTISYINRTDIEVVGQDHYKIDVFMKNHYNKTIDHTSVAGTLGYGINLIPITAVNLLPEGTVYFQLQNSSDLASCDFPIPKVTMPILVFKEEEKDKTDATPRFQYITYEIPINVCENKSCGVKVKIKYEELKNSNYTYEATFDSWCVYGKDNLDKDFTFSIGKRDLKLENKSSEWNLENRPLGGTNSMFIKVCVTGKCKQERKLGQIQYINKNCNN